MTCNPIIKYCRIPPIITGYITNYQRNPPVIGCRSQLPESAWLATGRKRPNPTWINHQPYYGETTHLTTVDLQLPESAWLVTGQKHQNPTPINHAVVYYGKTTHLMNDSLTSDYLKVTKCDGKCWNVLKCDRKYWKNVTDRRQTAYKTCQQSTTT